MPEYRNRPDSELLAGPPIGVGEEGGGYPYALGEKVPEGAIEQVGVLDDTHIGTDVAAAMFALRRARQQVKAWRWDAVEI